MALVVFIYRIKSNVVIKVCFPFFFLYFYVSSQYYKLSMLPKRLQIK